MEWRPTGGYAIAAGVEKHAIAAGVGNAASPSSGHGVSATERRTTGGDEDGTERDDAGKFESRSSVGGGGGGGRPRPALLQLATADDVYLFDLLRPGVKVSDQVAARSRIKTHFSSCLCLCLCV